MYLTCSFSPKTTASRACLFRFLDLMVSEQERLGDMGIGLLYMAHRSLDDSVAESSSGDVSLVAVAFALMIALWIVALAR